MDARPGALGTPRKLVGAGLIMGASMVALLFNSAMLAPDAQLSYEPSEAESANGDARMRGTLTGELYSHSSQVSLLEKTAQWTHGGSWCGCAGSSSKAVRGLAEAEAHRCSLAELDLTVQRVHTQ